MTFITFTYFDIFAGLSLVSAGLVIGATNPVHSVLFLILVFFNIAGLVAAAGLEFFALMMLVVYVGAIAVLFLFVVMMLNIRLAEIAEKRYRYLPISGLFGVLFALEIYTIVTRDLVTTGPLNWAPARACVHTDWTLSLDALTNVRALGSCAYTSHHYFFLCCGVILLIAMTGAIVLTHQAPRNPKLQSAALQYTREFAHTVQKIR